MKKGNKSKTAAQKLADLLLEQSPAERGSYADYHDFLEASANPVVKIEVDSEILDEAKKATVGRFTARRDSPHFIGDTYHGHCDVGGGHELSWSLTGKRRHSTKFPAIIPAKAKAAVAKVLGVSPDILESYWISSAGERILLVEVNE